jgi:hypothetical protein
VAVVVFGLHAASAQFTKLPRIPKTSRPQPTSDSAARPSSDAGARTTSQPSSPAASSAASAAADTSADDDQPTLNRNSLVVETTKTYRGSDDSWGWLPALSFRVNGPVASGSQLYAEFSLPTGGTWVKFDCKTHAVGKGETLYTECGGRDLPDEKGTTYTGAVSFSIKMRNELAGSDTPLFTGKAKVGKFPSGDGPKKFYYYVDQDWRLPVGYVFLWADDAVAGWDYPQLRVGFWLRGEMEGSVVPHLFYQGKEVGAAEAGDPSLSFCSQDGHPGSYDKAYAWKRVTCEFKLVRAWDKTGENRGRYKPLLFSEHPGEYEIKVMWHNHLARSIKFSVDSTGNIVDAGVAKANRLGTSVVIVPVQVLGAEDGTWDRNAWRTEAFYGNPLNGFNAP